jgi:transcriptional antiterminator
MKTRNQDILETILSVAIKRKEMKDLTNERLAEKLGVSVTTVANRVKSVLGSLEQYEDEYNNYVKDDRFKFCKLDNDIAAAVLDRFDNKERTGRGLSLIVSEAIHTQFARDWDLRQQTYKEDLAKAKEMGIKK